MRNDRVSYREIDPTFFVVVVDLWNGDGTQEQDRVLDHTAVCGQDSTASPNEPQLPKYQQSVIGTTQCMPPTGHVCSHGPTATLSGHRVHWKPYENLIGTSVSTGAHIRVDQGQKIVIFSFGDLRIRIEGIFRLRLRLINTMK